jgi:Ca-activated chloride channel family protein
VQQCNIANLVDQSIKMAEKNPEKAEELLETAKRMTLKLGNSEMTESLNNAQSELRKTQKISSGTRKTVKMGAKGKTVKMGNDIDDMLSEEEMRNIVGT